ncbi:MAG TPA: PPC domain-containing protein [Mycobacteriales bacterium]|nr:PPC domain-containing protein [Mycobacteriales bacterium]
MNRATVVSLAVLSAMPVVAGMALAAPPKPLTKTYTATAPLPDPTNQVTGAHQVCEMAVPQSFHVEKFDAPAPGTLKVEINGFVGDWDLLIQDPKGADVAAAIQTDTSTPAADDGDSTSVKVKKAGSYKIIACNWVGGPSAKVKYTFTFAK